MVETTKLFLLASDAVDRQAWKKKVVSDVECFRCERKFFLKKKGYILGIPEISNFMLKKTS